MPPGKTNGYAIASLVFGIFFCFCPAAFLAATYGHRARRKLREDPTQRGAGFAMAGLILGYLGIALTLLAIVIALPDFLATHRQP
jgi:threonine/homoserine/homoserine lactone efflux protein